MPHSIWRRAWWSFEKKDLDFQQVLRVTVGYHHPAMDDESLVQSCRGDIKQEVKPVWLITHP